MIGLILSNLGSPNSPDVVDVRQYLKDFLMDPFVIDIPWVLRALMVYGLILPKRPTSSSKAYQKVWTTRGSPLKFHTEDLSHKVQSLLGDQYFVEVGMRYGNPSIEKAVSNLLEKGVDEILFFPLYPQFSLAATQSSVEYFKRTLKKLKTGVSWSIIGPDFFEHRGFIKSFAKQGRKLLNDSKNGYDFVLFSFHGLPERQIIKLDQQAESQCLKVSECCDLYSEGYRPNPLCYKGQCFVTAHKIAGELGLTRSQYSISFQSRLGKTPWIKPYTDELLQKLPSLGIKRLLVFCPSFVADCLETLEEIEIRGRELFLSSGGEELKLVSSLNSSDSWADVISKMVLEKRIHLDVGHTESNLSSV